MCADHQSDLKYLEMIDNGIKKFYSAVVKPAVTG